jgi:TseV toxin immunity protein TsiV
LVGARVPDGVAELAAELAPTDLSGGEEVAALRLGLTVHFREPSDALLAKLASVWPLLEARPWARALVAVRSTRDRARRHLPEPPLTIADELRAAGAHAALYGLRVDDGAPLPSHSVELRVVHDWDEHARTSYLRVLLPVESDPAELLALAPLLADALPIWHGSAGFVFTYFAPEVESAFDQIFAWSRRYLGPAIAYAPAETWDGATALASLNWLVLVSDAFAAAHLPGLDLGGALAGDLSAARRGSGWIVRAGDGPRLGDLHRFERLPELTALARLLAAALPAEPTPFPGMFSDERCTPAWQKRWLDPVAWRDLQLG